MFSARRALGAALSKLSSPSGKASSAFCRPPEVLIPVRAAGTHISERSDAEFYGELHGDSDRSIDPSHYYTSYYNGGFNQQISDHRAVQFNQSHDMYDHQQNHQYPNVSISNHNHVNVENPKHGGTVEELEGLCKEGKLDEALEALALLEQNKTPIGLPTYALLMKLCGDEQDVNKAHQIHEHVLRSTGSTVENKIALNNKTLDMYIRCGSLEDARKLFDGMLQRNLTSWETMILGLAKNGKGEEALQFFNQLKTSGLPLDAGIFSTIFYVCGVIGAVDEGMLHLKSMEEEFRIAPERGTYVAIVNMLGQSGYLEEALEFVEHMMPEEPSVDVWETLMNLARLTGDLELGNRCADIVKQLDSAKLDKDLESGFVPVNKRELEKERQRGKASRIENRAQARQYVCGDRRDPEHKKIYALLNRLLAQMKEAGYVPDTRFVLHDVDQEAKEEALLGHSERLAAAYAFMTSPARTPIRIIKNLRCCGDCHNALKIISRLVGREIIARDAKRFHNFKDGVCSCKDYW